MLEINEYLSNSNIEGNGMSYRETMMSSSNTFTLKNVLIVPSSLPDLDLIVHLLFFSRLI